MRTLCSGSLGIHGDLTKTSLVSREDIRLCQCSRSDTVSKTVFIEIIKNKLEKWLQERVIRRQDSESKQRADTTSKRAAGAEVSWWVLKSQLQIASLPKSDDYHG